MTILDPISELSSFAMSIPLYRLADAELEESLKDFRAKMKATRAANASDWIALYRCAIELFQSVLGANERLRARVAPASSDPRQQAQALGGVATALQQALGPWQSRLQTQVKSDLMPKVEKSVLKLPVAPQHDESTGMTQYCVESNSLRTFLAWLDGVQRQWVENNVALLEHRSRELIDQSVPSGETPQFQLLPAEIPRLPGIDEQQLRLSPYQVPTPGPFELLSSSHKLVMSVVTATSGVGFLATRTFGASSTASTALSVILAVAFLGAVILAAATVPQKRRQALARIQREATTKVHDQLISAIERKLNHSAGEQLNAIRKYLQSEQLRASSLARKANSAAMPAVPQLLAAPRPLSEKDEHDLRVVFRQAVERRIATLEGR